MKALLVILAGLLVLAHPAAAAAVIVAELALCAALGWRIRRTFRRFSYPYPYWRSA